MRDNEACAFRATQSPLPTSVTKHSDRYEVTLATQELHARSNDRLRSDGANIIPTSDKWSFWKYYFIPSQRFGAAVYVLDKQDGDLVVASAIYNFSPGLLVIDDVQVHPRYRRLGVCVLLVNEMVKSTATDRVRILHAPRFDTNAKGCYVRALSNNGYVWTNEPIDTPMWFERVENSTITNEASSVD